MNLRLTINADGSRGKIETVCCVCGEPVDAAKGVSDSSATDDELLAAEVIFHSVSVEEFGSFSWRYYHADCYWEEAQAQSHQAEEVQP